MKDVLVWSTLKLAPRVLAVSPNYQSSCCHFHFWHDRWLHIFVGWGSFVQLSYITNKTPNPQRFGVIYHVKCENCKQDCVSSEMVWWVLGTRLKEHKTRTPSFIFMHKHLFQTQSGKSIIPDIVKVIKAEIFTSLKALASFDYWSMMQLKSYDSDVDKKIKLAKIYHLPSEICEERNIHRCFLFDQKF